MKHVRVRLALETEIARVDPIEDRVEESRHAGGLEHLASVAARRDQRGPHAALAEPLDQRDRSAIGLRALRAQALLEERVLAFPETEYGLLFGAVGRIALGERDAARGEKGAHALVARLAVDVGKVVALAIERPEARLAAARPPAQVRVEQLLPGGGMEVGGARDDAVHVEDDGPEAGLRGVRLALIGLRLHPRPLAGAPGSGRVCRTPGVLPGAQISFHRRITGSSRS